MEKIPKAVFEAYIVSALGLRDLAQLSRISHQFSTVFEAVRYLNIFQKPQPQIRKLLPNLLFLKALEEGNVTVSWIPDSSKLIALRFYDKCLVNIIGHVQYLDTNNFLPEIVSHPEKLVFLSAILSKFPTWMMNSCGNLRYLRIVSWLINIHHLLEVKFLPQLQALSISYLTMTHETDFLFWKFLLMRVNQLKVLQVCANPNILEYVFNALTDSKICPLLEALELKSNVYGSGGDVNRFETEKFKRPMKVMLLNDTLSGKFIHFDFVYVGGERIVRPDICLVELGDGWRRIMDLIV